MTIAFSLCVHCWGTAGAIVMGIYLCYNHTKVVLENKPIFNS